MADAVQIKFVTSGLRDVEAAFGSILKGMQQLDRVGTQSAERSARERVSIANREEKDRAKAAASLAKSIEREEREGTKAAEREAKRKDQIRENSAKMAARIYAQQTREEEREALNRTRVAEREAQRQTRIVEREAEAQARAAVSAHRRIASVTGSSIVNGTGRAIGGVMSIGAMAAGALGGFGVADAIRGDFAAQRSAAQLVNAVTSSGAAPRGATVKNILGQAGAISVETGMDKAQVVEGALAYARSARGGDFEGVKANMGFFAKMAKVTGASITDIAGAAGTLQSQNADLKGPEMQQMLLNAYAQSKSGSVSLTEAAKQFGTLGSTRGYYQGDQGKTQQTLIGLGQIAASGGMQGDIGTYIKDLSLEAGAHRDKTSKETGLGGRGLKSLGVKYDAQGRMESPEQMIGAVFDATKGDLSKIHAMFGSRGMPLFTELSKAYNSGFGGKTGSEAVKAQIASVTQSSMSAGDLDSQFKQVMATPAERFGKAMNEATEILQARLAPWLEKLTERLPDLVTKFEKLVDAGGALADWFLSNPLKGIGAVIALSVGRDIANAAIGEGIKALLLRLLAGGAPTLAGAFPAGAGAATGRAAQLLGGAAAVGAAGFVGWKVGEVISDAAVGYKASQQAADVGGSLDAGNLAARIRSGKMNAGDIEAAKKKVAELEDQKSHIGSAAGHALAFVTGQSENVKADETARAKLLQQAIDQLTKAIAANTAATTGNTGATSSNVNSPARSQDMGKRGGATG